MVVFTEYVDTLDWVVGVLKQHGYGPVLATIAGSTPTDERELVRARFTEHPAKDPMRVLVATDAAGAGIDLQAHCHRLVSFDVPFNPSRLEQRIGRIDRYGQRFSPEVYYLAPTSESSRYAADVAFLRRIAEKVSTVANDLGSVNQVIDGDIQAHFFRSAKSRAPRAEPDRSDAIVTKALADAMDLNRQLTALSQTYVERKVAMHLTPFNARRVVETALRLTAQPALIPVDDVDTDAEVFAVPAVGRLWQSTLAGLDTRLKPGVWRPVTFDADAARGRTDLVHVHLGHALLQKSARLLRASLYGSDSGLHRITAVVVDGLPTSCVAAVSRLVLVGRGGLRLHEEVFLTGARLSGRGLAEEKVHDVLDRALDTENLRLADEPVRGRLADLWNDDAGTVRARLETAVRERAAKRQDAVSHRLEQRRAADLDRAAAIFDAFAANLRDSLDTLGEDERLQLPIADEQARQRRRDIRAMEARLDTLADERARELTGIRERYADVRPYVSTGLSSSR